MPSSLPRQALATLLTQAEKAAASGDDARASALLSDLHWFGHADGELHAAVHRLELSMARRRGDVSGAAGQLLPNAFARLVARVESLGPSFEIEKAIAAPPEAVYDAIVDVARYGDWNPWIARVRGHAGRVGDEVVADVKLGKGTMRVKHRVLVAAPPTRFGWCDTGWFNWFASGRRMRWIEPTEGGSRLYSQIRLYGPFARLAWRLHGEAIRTGMTAEADALALRAASLAETSKAPSLVA